MSDWVPIRDDLRDDQAALDLVSRCGCVSVDHAVGVMARFWNWASSRTTDWTLRGASRSTIDLAVGVEGFADVFVERGWLAEAPGGLRLVDPDEYLSRSAKSRMEHAKKVRRARKAHKCAPGGAQTAHTERTPEGTTTSHPVAVVVDTKEGVKGRPSAVAAALAYHGVRDPVLSELAGQDWITAEVIETVAARPGVASATNPAGALVAALRADGRGVAQRLADEAANRRSRAERAELARQERQAAASQAEAEAHRVRQARQRLEGLADDDLAAALEAVIEAVPQSLRAYYRGEVLRLGPRGAVRGNSTLALRVAAGMAAEQEHQ